MTLEAFKYYYAPGKEVGVAGIVARPTPELLKLQQDVIAAVAPFTVDTGTMAAFVSAHDDPTLDALMIEYVSTFVPKMTNEHFSPHVSTGVPPGNTSTRCSPNRLRRLPSRRRARPSTNWGHSAAKKLKEWDLKQ
jgi:hypothetical protein